MSDDLKSVLSLEDFDIIAVEFAAALITGKQPEVIDHMAPQIAQSAYNMADAFFKVRDKRG